MSVNLLALAEKILAQSRARKALAGQVPKQAPRQQAKKHTPRQQAPRQQAKKHMPRDHIVRAGRGSSVPDLSAQLMSAAEPDWRSRASEIGQGVADEYGHEDPRWGFTGEGSEEDGTRAWNAFVAALEHSRSEMSDSMWRSRARKAFELVYEGYSPEEALGKAKLR